jgi:hypothetical protein
MSDLPTFAQTNVQLYNRLRADGRAEPALRTVRAAYELAAELFSGQYRADGRPFLCHLVGTADVLRHFGAPTATVAAGLLHSAYPNGDFGDGRRRSTPSRRARLRAAVGEAVERLVFAYEGVPPNPEAVARAAGAAAPDDSLREVVHIRFADAIEEHGDGALGYCRKPELLLRDEPARRMLSEAAARLDLTGPFEMLDQLARQKPEPPECLRSDRMAAREIPPMSYRLRTWVRLRRRLGK